MKKMKRWNLNYIAMVLLLLAGCESFEEKQQETQLPIRFMAEYPGMSRVTASAFEQEDRIGVFMNVEGEPLEASGNSLNNELLEFDGSAWNAERDLFWDAGRFDVYAYYPYDDDMRVVDDYPFSVSLNCNCKSSKFNLLKINHHDKKEFKRRRPRCKRGNESVTTRTRDA